MLLYSIYLQDPAHRHDNFVRNLPFWTYTVTQWAWYVCAFAEVVCGRKISVHEHVYFTEKVLMQDPTTHRLNNLRVKQRPTINKAGTDPVVVNVGPTCAASRVAEENQERISVHLNRTSWSCFSVRPVSRNI